MAKPRNDTQCRKGKLCVGKWLCSCASTEQVKLRSKYCPKYLNIPHCPICGDFSQYFRLFEIRGIVRRGGRGRGWDHIWLDQASHPRVSDEYANTNTHPFLCLVAGWLDLILIFRLPHNVCSRLTVGERPISHSDWELLWQSEELPLEEWSESYYRILSLNSSDLKQAQKCPWNVQVQISWEQWSTNFSLAAIILVFAFCPLAPWKGFVLVDLDKSR